MKINIFPFSNCSPKNPRISFGDSFYADPDRLSEKESGEGEKFLYQSGLSLLKSMISFVVKIQRENQGALGIFC